MAYIVSMVKSQNELADNEVLAYKPIGAEIGDLLLVLVSQDAGSSVITATGLTSNTQTSRNAQRLATLYAVVDANTPDTFKVNGTSAAFSVLSILIREADTTSPFLVISEATSPTTGRSFNIAGITIPNPDTLVLFARSSDGNTSQMIDVFSESGEAVTALANLPENLRIARTQSMIVMCKYFESAITTGAVNVRVHIGSEGGTHLALAIRNKAGYTVVKPTFIKDNSKIVNMMCGLLTTASSTAVAWSYHSSVPFTSALPNMPTCQGVPMTAGTNTIAASAPLNTSDKYEIFCPYMTVANSTVGGNPLGEFFGAATSNPHVDLSNSTLLIEISTGTVIGSRIGEYGCVMVLKDNNGNLAAYTILITPYLISNKLRAIFVSIKDLVPVEVFGAIDLTNIVEIHLLLNKYLSSATLIIRRLLVVRPISIIGGSTYTPSRLSNIVDHTQSTASFALYNTLGDRQYKVFGGVLIGNGVDKTVVDMSLNSIETPSKKLDIVEFNVWNPRYGDAGFEINMSQFDEVDLRSATISTSRNQPFLLPTYSSPDGVLHTKGLTLYGYTLEAHTIGLTLDGILVTECYTAIVDGCMLTDSTVRNTLSEVSVITPNLGLIHDCNFDNKNSHDIELTQTGTYTSSGNIYTQGGVKKNIVNSSGGNIVIQVVGGTMPTVKNLAGATTTVTQSVSVKLTGLQAGTEVRVYDSLSSEIAGIESTSGGEFTFNITPATLINIVIFHVEYDPLYIDNYEVANVNTSIPVVQNVTRSYQP